MVHIVASVVAAAVVSAIAIMPAIASPVPQVEQTREAGNSDKFEEVDFRAFSDLLARDSNSVMTGATDHASKVAPNGDICDANVQDYLKDLATKMWNDECGNPEEGGNASGAKLRARLNPTNQCIIC